MLARRTIDPGGPCSPCREPIMHRANARPFTQGGELRAGVSAHPSGDRTAAPSAPWDGLRTDDHQDGHRGGPTFPIREDQR